MMNQQYQGWPGQFQPMQPMFQQTQPMWQPTTNNMARPFQQVTGRTVASAAEITPNEVPMDGSMSLFPLSDGSAIIGKRWGADGSISTVTFVPEKQGQPAEAHQEVPGYISDICTKLDGIEELLVQQRQQRRTVRPKEQGNA